jgi:hypothetical protein
MNPVLLAAATEEREAGPIGLVVILCLLVALIFLIRSMNKHLRKVPADRFPGRADATAPEPTDPGDDRSS